MKYIELDEGLGDNIICAGLIAYLARNEKVILRIPERQLHNKLSYETFFAGLDVEFYDELKHMPEENPHVIQQRGIAIDSKIKGRIKLPWYKLGNNNPVSIRHKLKVPTYPLGFYRQFDLTYNDRFTYCPLRQNSLKVDQIEPNAKYIFMHDDVKRGYRIDMTYFIKKDIGMIVPPPVSEISVLSYRNVIENAEEIHCIDSSFFHLVNAFKPKGKLFYHMYARPNSPEFAYHTEWTRLR